MFTFSQFVDALIKGHGHRYIKRIPYMTPKGRRYRYIYKVTHSHKGKQAIHEDHLDVGTKFMLHTESGKEVHGHIKSVDGDKVTYVIDDGADKGKEISGTKSEILAMLNEKHGVEEKLREKRDQLQADIEQARKTGTRRQVARLEAQLRRLGDDPDRIQWGVFTDTRGNRIEFDRLSDQDLQELKTASERGLKESQRKIKETEKELKRISPATDEKLNRILRDTKDHAKTYDLNVKRIDYHFAKQAKEGADKGLSKKEVALANQIQSSAKKNLDFLQRIITADRRESNEYRMKKALQASVENIFNEVAKPLGLDDDYLYIAKMTPRFLDIDATQNADFFDAVYKGYENASDTDKAHLEAYHKIIEQLVDHTATHSTGGGLTAEERRNFKKLNRRFKAQADLISEKLLKPQAESSDNFETMPESKAKPAKDSNQEEKDDMSKPASDLKNRLNTINRLDAKMRSIQSVLYRDKLAKDELKMPKAKRTSLTKLKTEITKRLKDLRIYDHQHEIIRNHVMEQVRTKGKINFKDLPRPNKAGQAMFLQVIDDIKTKGIDWLIDGENEG